MNKKELVESLAGELETSKKTAALIVEGVIKILARGIVDEGYVQLANFGTFKVRDMEPKTGHNPRTGKPIQIPARSQVFFSTGKALKERVNGRNRRR